MNKIVLLDDHTDAIQSAHAAQLIRNPQMKWIDDERYATFCVYKYHYPDHFVESTLPVFCLTEHLEMSVLEDHDEFVLYKSPYKDYLNALLDFQANHLCFKFDL